MPDRADIVILMTDEERAVPPYEAPEVLAWRERTLAGRKWFDEDFTDPATGGPLATNDADGVVDGDAISPFVNVG